MRPGRGCRYIWCTPNCHSGCLRFIWMHAVCDCFFYQVWQFDVRTASCWVVYVAMGSYSIDWMHTQTCVVKLFKFNLVSVDVTISLITPCRSVVCVISYLRRLTSWATDGALPSAASSVRKLSATTTHLLHTWVGA